MHEDLSTRVFLRRRNVWQCLRGCGTWKKYFDGLCVRWKSMRFAPIEPFVFRVGGGEGMAMKCDYCDVVGIQCEWGTQIHHTVEFSYSTTHSSEKFYVQICIYQFNH
mmetsp:Transcript_25149/g.53005  ORF Transcript_25149/g.53005 Transcript_25149/m.53005 type:complete len:107 (+) Transcript_25149:585-905(+)